jgi:Transposase.
MADNNRFTNQEYAEMHFIYGLCNGNATAARRTYIERYPQRRQPSTQLFTRIHRRIIETGSVVPRYIHCGRIARRLPAQDEQILRSFEQNPGESVRRAANQLQLSRMSVWRVLKENGLYAYHLQKVQHLMPEDLPRRLEFCRIILNHHQHNVEFISSILFTDEATFTRDGLLNLHNAHAWSDENPHATIDSHHQHRFSVNVWAGIIGDYLLGPFFLPQRLDAVEYLNFLENHLPELMENVPLNLRQYMWYLHDGAPAHFSVHVREYLHMRFPNRWIGRGYNAPIAWPPRSPDLNPVDFYLWGHAKSQVYATPVDTEDQLRLRIVETFNLIRNSLFIFQRVRFNFIKRLTACIDAEGGQFQHLL